LSWGKVLILIIFPCSSSADVQAWEVFTPNYEVLTAPRSVRLIWIAASNGRVPPGAMVGGNEKGQSLYVCRAAYQDGLHPGKVIGRNCNIGWGGREVLRPNYEVLVL
jgi:hypothetical protein